MVNNGDFISSCSACLLKFIGLITLFVCSHAAASAQDFEVDPSFVLDQWTVDDGLPVNNVVDILQAKNGYLWLATFDGLVRFDGIEFKVYQSESYPNLPSNRILTVDEALDGSIWMTTEPGFVVYFKDGEFHRATEQNGLNGNLANEYTFIDHEGVLWIPSNKGISTYDGETLAPYRPEKINGNIQNVFVETNGAVWYRMFDNPYLFRISEDEMERFDYPLKNTIRNLPMYEDPETGWIWVGKISDTYVYIGNTFEYHSSTEAEFGISGFYRDPHGKMWLISESYDTYVWHEELQNWETQFEGSLGIKRNNFLYSRDENLWFITGRKIFEAENKILSTPDLIYTYLFDKEGSLWLGTETSGLVRLKKNLFKTYTGNDGMPWANVFTIIEDYDNNIWAGTYRSGVGVIGQNGVVETVGIEETAWGGFIITLFMGQDSTIYAGSIGAGLSWIEPGKHIFRKEENTGADTPINIKAFYEDQNGDLWLGTPNGLFIGGIGAWNKVDEQRFSNFEVRAIIEAPDGSLWLGTYGAGIVRFDENEFTFYGMEEGFTSNIFRSFYITDVRSEQEYTLWVGTEDRGLVRIEIQDGEPNLQTLTRYGTQIGMLDFAIHNIQEDDFGFFWMNTNRGIFRIEKEQLEQYHRGEIDHLNGISFTESDGLINREGNGGNQSPGIKASDGRIWFANQAGAVVFDPADFVDVENELIPPVVIEEITTSSGTFLNIDNRLIELEKTERNFEIRFTALSLISPERNNFRYRLLGFNDEWIETNGQRSAVYTNIPNGTYTFEVMASNNTGTWNPEPAQMTFTIAPHFYETAWFKIGVLSFFGLMFFAGFQWRVRSLKRSEELLKKRVEMRTLQLKKEKEKTEEQAERLKELDKAKTRFFTNISHELRTPLTLIMSPLQQMLSEKGNNFDAQTQEEFRRMLRNSDRLLRLIDQTLDINRLEQGRIRLKISKQNLRDFIDELVDLFTSVAIEKEINIRINCEKGDFTLYADPDKLDEIIANLLSNAIKFTPEGKKIDISITEENNMLELKVADTGIGIAPENLDKIFERFYQVDSSETRFQEGSGIGLSLVKEFVKLHQGELLVESEIDVGTTFTLRFKKGNDHFTREELAEETSFIPIQKVSTNGVPDSEVTEFEQEYSEDQTTVLVVEDNADLRAFIERILMEEYRVLTAANGEEGLEVVSNDLPDLIVADIMMPKVDGITFNRMLKQNPETASIPLIFLTAKSTKQNRIKGFNEGGDAYLTKPFDPAILKARIHNLITSRFRLREILAGADHKKTENGQELRDPFVLKALAILAQNFTDPDFNVTRFSKALYMDRSQVLRKLKESVDLSPSAFIKKYRMDKAAELLQNETDNISEVAYAVGFKSLSYFSYCFKEHFQLSPSEYLKSTKV